MTRFIAAIGGGTPPRRPLRAVVTNAVVYSHPIYDTDGLGALVEKGGYLVLDWEEDHGYGMIVSSRRTTEISRARAIQAIQALKSPSLVR